MAAEDYLPTWPEDDWLDWFDDGGDPTEQGIRLEPTQRTWVTKHNQRVAVKDMTDEHLFNAIGYLRRTHTTDSCPTYGTMVRHAKRRKLPIGE